MSFQVLMSDNSVMCVQAVSAAHALCKVGLRGVKGVVAINSAYESV